MTNMELAAKVIQELVDTGVREFVLCAGARNSPLVHILDENKNLKVYTFFEERSAAFFALGRIASSRRPVAIFTTSGTAVAELLPAAVEGTYSSLPLIMITADRPKHYRGSGAPQTIEQVGIFSYYNEVALDLDAENSHLSFKSLSWKKPIHVNVSFEEPLIDGPVPQIKIPAVAERTKLPGQTPLGTLKEMETFLNTHKPLVIVGILPEKAYGTVLEFLKQYKAPVYAEGISSLRGHPELQDILIQSGEQMIHRILQSGECDSILRIGGVPTVRLWRDLEDKYRKIPVFSVSFNHYTGLSREVQHVNSLDLLSQVEFTSKQHENVKVNFDDAAQAAKVRALLMKYPESEQGMIYSLSKKMKKSSVYLGNSLPIREWDSCADQDSPPLRVAANRGANGIDGQISTFMGWAHPETENWCLVGDLTAMYDLSALWVTSQVDAQKFRIVVINNGGGQIFSRMFKKEIFINKHQISFESWAKMWNWSYQQWHNIPVTTELADKQIIELLPNAQQTQDFWKELEALWKE
ncbi:2-succinyl-5-enolpyruvyl-6-hydroxy-3-cyclohexene-1-carboxylic-acid synthase [Bdellovibrio svalbardensis]|uniref:2-succinyl-5-enolpyruvyl-6-hydroxy-3-cyclohexene-1-carboxylate synthase n=1 Tax=Bdellovibrio svalbardensis TaxID=2972972 RepID=A0ABT6DHF3_9BACT|nr:2-succinyl-5-enolpyruvyl-6-hydroxy-3-cyclohexene-1-carboxylic-acid synthase [Bdellovibrio svalbardensis]MDG0815281.1 2-succinyl-5-enolpyruvyl-6-hydroxy-3-cyclohexene-1-carboxylic-acid synthase [Bdellovibrio svalbardensis]